MLKLSERLKVSGIASACIIILVGSYEVYNSCIHVYTTTSGAVLASHLPIPLSSSNTMSVYSWRSESTKSTSRYAGKVHFNYERTIFYAKCNFFILEFWNFELQVGMALLAKVALKSHIVLSD